ncbi:hypothetical protein [Luteococcus sp. OSA5]|uniref:hypothetical protein n=1 Tax=Luteococcus sp. OSA5 TaxID=3401630 RepID=UPI003B42B742
MKVIMNIPQIPGFTSDELNDLGGLWDIPSGSFPPLLWPSDWLSNITPSPKGWLAVEEYRVVASPMHGTSTFSTGCLLVDAGSEELALEATNWLGEDLGKVECGPHMSSNGLSANVRGEGESCFEVSWFVNARQALGSDLPQVELSNTFLWFWDAFPVGGGWSYLDAAGRTQELVRYRAEEGSWFVEIRADEFQTFLHYRGASAVLYKRSVIALPRVDFDRVDDEFHNAWGHFSFFATGEPTALREECFSMLDGNYVIKGRKSPRLPRFDDFSPEEIAFEEFIYARDGETGKLMNWPCDPKALSSYHSTDSDYPHYLTPIYFRREVLQDYLAQPSRYHVTPFRLSCLHLWGVDISINTAGLVEVYLGDIAQKIPHQDWGHWKSYNVPPEGKMEEGRFRRDFLGQFVDSPDPIGDLKRARVEANQRFVAVFGDPLWKELPKDLELEYRSLMGPMNEDPVSLNGPVLILTKVFVDSLNSKLLRSQAPVGTQGQSLAQLKSWLEARDVPSEPSKVLSNLYALRSRGGVAHLSNSDSPKAQAQLGISGMKPSAAFDHIIHELTESVKSLADSLAREEGGNVSGDA